LSAESNSDRTVANVGWAEAWNGARALIEPAQRFTVAGADASVQISALDWGGDGDLAVLHHANGFSGAVLAEVASRLSARYRVVAVDARGHGDSTPVAPTGDPDPYDWDTLAKDAECAIRGILKRTGHERVALAIGHSFGGALLLRAAAKAPASIERLLLCDPVIMPPMTQEQLADPSRGPGLAEATRRRRDHFASSEEAYLHCGSRGLFKNFTPEALALYAGAAMRETDDGQVTLKCHREVEAAIFDGGPSSSGVGVVEDVTAQVLFVHARRGNFSAAYYEEIAARMSKAKVVSRDLAHLFPLEEPNRVIELLDEMLAEGA